MKLICRYSGIEWNIPNCFGNLPGKNASIVQTHPVFHLPIKTLLAQMGRWSASFDPNNKNPMTVEERKLLFLALLHSTGLIHWRAVANIAVETADKHMERLARFLNYYEAVQAPEKVFPQFVLGHSNRALHDIGMCIEAWSNSLTEFKSGMETARLIQKLQVRERALEKLINSSLTNNSSDHTRYTNQLAAWALDVTAPLPSGYASRKEFELASKVFNDTRDYWTSLFGLRGMEIYTARTADLEELQDWLVAHMPKSQWGNLYSDAVMRRVNLLVARNRAGLNFGLDIPNASDIDIEELEARPFNILPDDEVEEHNTALAALRSPMKEPIIADYASKIDYLRAKAAYVLATKQLNKILIAEQREAETAAKETMDAINASEEEPEETITLRDI